ncbi:hypothetical protein RND81_13G048200 [Saponaria officinalis]|uniref:Bifunctional inhibitor/plant lipid transfer protein/seed storage helical domain-containing protein n=1 Tax=Saponaria officinalis TaxID=3572 RepID=A0AAW1GW57_SAPOF
MKMTMTMIIVVLVVMLFISLPITPSMAQTECASTANNIARDCDSATTITDVAECCASLELAATIDTPCLCLIFQLAIDQYPTFSADALITACGIPGSFASLCPGTTTSSEGPSTTP